MAWIPETPHPTTATAAKPFRWQQLESADAETFVANLRATGCPEQTIQDIVSAEYERQLKAEPKADSAEPAQVQPGSVVAATRKWTPQLAREILNARVAQLEAANQPAPVQATALSVPSAASLSQSASPQLANVAVSTSDGMVTYSAPSLAMNASMSASASSASAGRSEISALINGLPSTGANGNVGNPGSSANGAGDEYPEPFSTADRFSRPVVTRLAKNGSSSLESLQLAAQADGISMTEEVIKQNEAESN